MERQYGQWAGNPKGYAEKPTRCVAHVGIGAAGTPGGYQCLRNRGYGPGGLYCKQHAKRAREEG